MRFEEDFRGGGEREAGERLLACYQEALGHQLPNRLVALQGLARLLEESAGDRLGPEVRSEVARLGDLARDTDRLVRALADIGRLCRDARTGGPVGVAEAAREAGAEVKVLSPGVVIEYDFPGDLPAAPVSRRSLYQVLVELLRNAAQAAGAAPIHVGGRRAAAGIEVWVADDGPGLPAVSPQRLFAPFQRAGGRGFGLFLVRQVTASWGGSLRVHSEPGRGTRVTVHIPVEGEGFSV
jgi:signal transduction histidine kinase